MLAVLTTVGAVADEGGYRLQSAFISANVSVDNVWDITEVLTVNFLEPRHGIYKYIPSKFSYSFPDATGKMVPYDYTNYIFDCDVLAHEYSTETDSGDDRNTILKIGSADKRVTGLHKYVIKYKIRYLDDRYDGEDFLCHSIWGNGWNTTVDTLMFQISFEKQLPADIEQTLNVYSGKLGTTTNADSVNVYYKAEDNSLRGLAYNLGSYNAVTLSSQLPQGFWEIKPKDLTAFYIFAGLAALFALLTVVSLVTAKRYRPIRVLSFYPPNDMSSAEVGTVIDNVPGNEDLASLVPWMAHKGYINIVENVDEKGAKLKDNLTLTKVKDLPYNAPEYQKSFMNALFSKSESIQLKSLSLTYVTNLQIVRGITNIFSGERALIQENSNAVWSWSLMLLCMLGAASTCNVVDNFNISYFFLELLSTVAALIWMGRHRKKKSFEYENYSWFKKITSIIKWALVMFLVISVNIVWFDDGLLAIPVDYIVFGSLGASLVTYFLNYAIGNTKYRAQVLGELEGLREFIETAELPRLKMLVDENPQYFYDILPYAMVFGLTSKWVKLFESIKVENPEWYISSSPMKLAAMPLLMNKISTRVSDSIRDSISSSSSGYSYSSSGRGYSGGGRSYSGGGGGGGGGGSW